MHAHESPLVMTLPLLALGLLSLVGGVALLWTAGGIVGWLEPVVGEEEHALPFPVLVLTALTLAVVVAVVALAWVRYGRERVSPAAPTRVSFATTAARKDLYGDAVNEVALMRPGQQLTRSLVYAESRGLDRAVNGVAALMGGSSGRLRRVQTGFVRSYALSMLGGTVLVVLALLSVRLA